MSTPTPTTTRVSLLPAAVPGLEGRAPRCGCCQLSAQTSAQLASLPGLSCRQRAGPLVEVGETRVAPHWRLVLLVPEQPPPEQSFLGGPGTLCASHSVCPGAGAGPRGPPCSRAPPGSVGASPRPGERLSREAPGLPPAASHARSPGVRGRQARRCVTCTSSSLCALLFCKRGDCLGDCLANSWPGLVGKARGSSGKQYLCARGSLLERTCCSPRWLGAVRGLVVPGKCDSHHLSQPGVSRRSLYFCNSLWMAFVV